MEWDPHVYLSYLFHYEGKVARSHLCLSIIQLVSGACDLLLILWGLTQWLITRRVEISTAAQVLWLKWGRYTVIICETRRCSCVHRGNTSGLMLAVGDHDILWSPSIKLESSMNEATFCFSSCFLFYFVKFILHGSLFFLTSCLCVLFFPSPLCIPSVVFVCKPACCAVLYLGLFELIKSWHCHQLSASDVKRCGRKWRRPVAALFCWGHYHREGNCPVHESAFQDTVCKEMTLLHTL